VVGYIAGLRILELHDTPELLKPGGDERSDFGR